VANQVTDNRTNVSTGETATGWEDIGGTALSVDTEISYDTYTGSIGNYVTTTRDGTFYNNAATGLFSSGDHAYLLFNCGVVSLLDSKVNGGVTVRVTGATATDWAEFELFGAEEYPTAFSGGWVQIVVDIDELLANPTNVNGTPPTVGNIQRFGITFITATVMPRMTDNFWVGGFKILGSATPALIVEGRDAGTTDWNLTSIAAVAAVKLSAVLLPGPGGSFVCRGPIQYGINDTTTHAFTESNKTLLWDFQEVMLDGFYGLSAVGGVSGTTNVTFGLKTGTGDDATGSQGGSIQAASTAARWDMDFNNANVDGINLYGVQFIHGGDFLLDSTIVSCISSAYIDCTSALVSNSEQLRIAVIDANTADGVAFMTTDDLTDIVNSVFEFSDGHAIELTTPRVASQTSKGNTYTNYGADATNDAAVYNNTAGAVTIGVTSGGSPTVRNGTSASTTITNNVNIDISGLTKVTPVTVIADETVGTITVGDVLSSGFTDATGDYSFSQNYEGAFDPSGLDVVIRARNQGVAASFAVDGVVVTNETTEGSSNTSGDMNILPVTVALNDWYGFGHLEQFGQLRIWVGTAVTWTGTKPLWTWEYFKSVGGWTALSGVVDGTDDFANTGANIVSWTIPGDWDANTVSGDPGGFGDLYLIRARFSTVGGITGRPLGDKVQLDATRYLPYVRNRTISATGLSDVASWVEDSISNF
jgi:hypothetical protein